MSRKSEFIVLLSILVLTLAAAAFLFPSRRAESASSTMTKSATSCEHETGSAAGCGHNEPAFSASGLAAISAHAPARAASGEHEAKMLADALRKKPDHVPVLIRMAGIAAAQKDFETALGYLRAALKHEPDNPELSLELGRIFFEKGDPAAAIGETQKLLKRHPRHPDGLYNLGAIHANLGNREKAEECWKELMASSPDSESGRRAKIMLAELRRSLATSSAALHTERVGP